jgi:uncharacterized membrane protein (DUF4010 family)
VPGALFHSAFLEILILFVVWLFLLLVVVVGGVPVILVRALLRGRGFFTSLTADFRAVFRWWWDHHPFQ